MSILLRLISLLLLVSFWASASTYAFFWFENAWKPAHEPLGALVLRGFLSSFASIIFTILIYPLVFLDKRWNLEAGPGPGPGPVVVLTHGLYHNATGWLLFSRRLRRAGFRNIFFMNYGSFFTDFEKTFEKFDKFVTAVSAAAPGRPLFLIGHSLGGLLTRVYAERATGAAIPAGVITIGSPHRGTKLAAFGLGKLTSDIIYRGPLFTRLESGSPELHCPALALISPADNTVFPSEALEVPHEGWSYFQTSALSHIAMLYSKSVAGKAIEFLEAAQIRDK